MLWRLAVVGALTLALWPGAAQGQRSITWGADEMVEPGVRLRRLRFNQSSTVGSEAYAASVHLCQDGVSMAATAPRTSLQRTSGWADPGGITLAVNGDFYENIGGRWMIYGDAVGNGVQWPCENNGVCLGDWHWASGNYGWIAVGDGWVDFTHSEHVKHNRAAFAAAGYSVDAGWAPEEARPAPRPGTFSLISGFSELVVEGRVVTCPDPTGGCFADRGDMAARNPRTAIGITADRRTLLLVVVDGRGRRASAGVTGEELAWLVGELGAWQAFNLDGGGSSTMWLRGRGIVNSPSDGAERAVLNHVGVFTSGASGAVNCCAPEECNGVDDDCDGQVDELASCADAGVTAPDAEVSRPDAGAFAADAGGGTEDASSSDAETTREPEPRADGLPPSNRLVGDAGCAASGGPGRQAPAWLLLALLGWLLGRGSATARRTRR